MLIIDEKEIDRIAGAWLRVRRTRLGMSQTQIGEAAGVTYQQIQKYEGGMNSMSIGRFLMFCDALGEKAPDVMREIEAVRPGALTSAVPPRRRIELMKLVSKLPDDLLEVAVTYLRALIKIVEQIKERKNS